MEIIHEFHMQTIVSYYGKGMFSSENYEIILAFMSLTRNNYQLPKNKRMHSNVIGFN